MWPSGKYIITMNSSGASMQAYPLIDIESIALHEMGHGLSQAHFGTLFRTPSNGKFHFSPMAVMNAGYVYIPWHELMATDIAGHCSIWASWPKR